MVLSSACELNNSPITHHLSLIKCLGREEGAASGFARRGARFHELNIIEGIFLSIRAQFSAITSQTGAKKERRGAMAHRIFTGPTCSHEKGRCFFSPSLGLKNPLGGISSLYLLSRPGHVPGAAHHFH